MDKLKPCPFCGDPNPKEEIYCDPHDLTEYYYIFADNKWRSVSEEKPFAEYGEGDSVLTVNTNGVMRVAYWDGGNWLAPDGNLINTTKSFPITHWMPLPEPPKEVQSAK